MAIGSLVGTLFVLASTITLIPIQKASDSWSPVIANAYKSDKKITAASIILCLIIVLVFAFSFMDEDFFRAYTIPSLGYNDNYLRIFLAFTFLGITLDILRWFYNYIPMLLNPVYGINYSTAKINIAITDTEKVIAKKAKFIFSQRAFDDNITTVTKLKADLYRETVDDPFSYYLDSIAEIAIKAIKRDERQLMHSSISSLATIANTYFKTRHDSIEYGPVGALLLGYDNSNIDKVITHINEILRSISNCAIREKSEIAISSVTKTYLDIAECITCISDESTRLFYSPFYYMCEHILSAEKAGLVEPVFQSTETTLRMVLRLSPTLDTNDVYTVIIDWMLKKLAFLLGQGRHELASAVSDRIGMVLFHVYLGNNPQRNTFLEHALQNLAANAQLAALCDLSRTDFGIQSCLSGLYGSTSSHSIAKLFEIFAYQTTKDIHIYSTEEISGTITEFNRYLLLIFQTRNSSSYVNLILTLSFNASYLDNIEHLFDVIAENSRHIYANIIDLSEAIRSHWRAIADKTETGGSLILRDYLWSSRDICLLLIANMNLIESRQDGTSDDFQLSEELKWHLSFFWAIFQKKKLVDYNRAREAIDAVIYIGLLSLSDLTWHVHDILLDCCDIVFTIANSYHKQENAPDPVFVIKLAGTYWCLRLAAEHHGYSAAVTEIDKKYASFVEKSEQPLKNEIIRSMDRRKSHISEYVEDKITQNSPLMQLNTLDLLAYLLSLEAKLKSHR